MSALSAVLGVLQTGLVLLVILTVLVVVHELGHFLLARAFGMDVDAFAIFMGGVRKTKLEPYLRKPLAPKRLVWLCALIAALAYFVGLALNLSPVYLVGEAALGLALPFWVVTRLEALYHLPTGGGLRTLGTWCAIAVMMIAIATHFQGVAAGQVLGVVMIAAWCGTLAVYYAPVLKKTEETPQGHGQLAIPGWEPTGDEAEAYADPGMMPVRFCPLAARKSKAGTEYSLLLLPLGGFAAIKGMHPKEDGSEVKVPGGFYSKAAFARFVVLLAGPAFSILFSSVLLFAMYASVGEPQPANGTKLGGVQAEMPAAKAGLKEGDQIVSVDGVPVHTWFEFTANVRDKLDQKISLTYVRNGVETTAALTPVTTKEAEDVIGPDDKETGVKRRQARIGVQRDTYLQRLAPGKAAVEAFVAPVRFVDRLVFTLSKPGGAKESFGGPASVAVATRDAASQGIYNVLMLAALLSLSFGVMNLLPIHPMDGGQICVALVEMVRGGRRLSLRVQNTVALIGITLLVLLVISTNLLDIERFMGGSAKTKPAASAPGK